MDENMALTPYETREILFYKTDNGDVKVEILLYQENLWLTQAKMAELFEVQKAAISKHLKNIFASGELMEDSVVSVLETTAADGKKYPTRYYNLDAIIAVGYRVNSKKATIFRIWANRILKEYIIKGYVMDDERLKECRFVNDVLHNGERKKDGTGRLPVERAPGEIVVLSLPNSKLLGKVFKGIECVAGIKLSRVAQIFVSGVAHFFVVVGGSKIHERLAHFFVDIYIAHTFYAQPPRHKHLTNPETKKGADFAKNSAKSAPESLGR